MTTTSPTPPKQSILDKPALIALRLNWEKVAWIVLLILALALRLYDLGARTMSHDESLHTQYSYNLFKGIGYKHDPLMHGPFLFELSALSYFLLGANDFSARFPVALFGVGLVALMWFTRRWLGRWGAFLAGVFLAFSPMLLYHSRYIRHDMYLIFFVVLTAILTFRYIEEGRSRWLFGLSAALAFSFTTMEASFLYAIIFVGFLLLSSLVRVYVLPWERRNLFWPFLALLVIGGALTVYPLYEAIHAPVSQYVTSARLGGMVMWPLFLIGLIVLGAAFWLCARGLGIARLRGVRELDVTIWVLALAAPLYAAFPIKLFAGNPQSVSILQNMLQPGVLRPALIFVIMLVLFAVIGFLWGRRRFLISLGLFYVILLLLFTTFFTNGNGVATGLVGSMGYWLAQQSVQRGSQPWFYYFLIVPLYEFLPLLLSFIAMITLALRGLRRRSLDPTGEGDPVASPLGIRSQWLLFLGWWILAVWGLFSYAGEKMPWLSTHFTTPMCILAGWYLAERIKVIDWSGLRAKRGLWLLFGIPLWIFALIALLNLRPFRGSDLDSLSDTMAWLAALALLIGLGWLVVRSIRAVGWRPSGQMAFLSLIGLLGIFSLRTGLLYNFVNYDYATEPGVYAHGTPDIKIAVQELQEISRRTVGENQIAFAYDDQTTWPFEWYFRDFPNKKFFGGTPSRDVLRDAPVVFVGTENEDKVRPYLDDAYYRIPYRQIWWPKETYKQLKDGAVQPDGQIAKGLKLLSIWAQDPAARKNFWDMLIYRRYQQPVADWDPSDRFIMFVRKDIAAQAWNQGATPPTVVEPVVDPFEGKYQLTPAVLTLGGVAGTEPGQLALPRAVAVGPDGRIYVADSGNHRIAIFNPDGSFVSTFGSFGEGPGQLNEPWGIAVGKDGRVYVSDTWNHRIQVFDADGQYLSGWGSFVATNGELGESGVFWGPRGIALDDNGNLYVADTGNKRIQVFDADGNFVTQFGGVGLDAGKLDEPTGVAVGADGSIYVADTWNQRIQKFDANYQYVGEWPVTSWVGESIVNKPAVVVDDTGTVYASDPGNWRILVWDSEGQPKAVLGQYGAGLTDFALPNGLAIDADGALWVADADNNRVMKFDPVQ